MCIIYIIGLCQIWVNARPILSDLGQRPTLYQIWVNGATCFIRSGSTPCQQSKPATHVQIWVNASTGSSDLGQRAASRQITPRKIRSGSTHQPSCQIWVNGRRTGARTRKSATTGKEAAALALPWVSPCVANVPVCGVYLGSPIPLCADHSPFDATAYNAPSRCCCYRGWCCRAAAARAAHAAHIDGGPAAEGTVDRPSEGRQQ
jgi:hypothetical protein